MRDAKRKWLVFRFSNWTDGAVISDKITARGRSPGVFDGISPKLAVINADGEWGETVAPLVQRHEIGWYRVFVV